MSNRDYTKFSKPEAERTVAEIQAEKVEQIEETPVVEEVVVPEKKPVIGVVTNCVKLNIRKYPKPNSTVLCTVDCKSDLVIDEADSTNDYYKVCTAAGIEGYCMKKFVTIMP